MALLVDQAKSQPGQVREARAALSALSAGLGGEIDELEERSIRRALAWLRQAALRVSQGEGGGELEIVAGRLHAADASGEQKANASRA